MAPVTAPMSTTSMRARRMKAYWRGSVKMSMSMDVGVRVGQCAVGAAKHDDRQAAISLGHHLRRVGLRRRAVGHHALVHAAQAVAGAGGAGQVVGGQQDDAPLLAELLDDLEDHLLGGGV